MAVVTTRGIGVGKHMGGRGAVVAAMLAVIVGAKPLPPQPDGNALGVEDNLWRALPAFD